MFLWKRYLKLIFKFFIVFFFHKNIERIKNVIHILYIYYHYIDISYNFKKDNFNYGYHDFIDQKYLYEKNQYNNNSIVENGRTVVGVYLQIYKYNNEGYFFKYINIKR